MKIIKTANHKRKIKLSKSEWQNIGKRAGWISPITKTANKFEVVFEVVDSSFNRANYSDLIGKILDNPPAYANVKLIKDDKKSLQSIFDQQSKFFAEDNVNDMLEDFVIKALKSGYDKPEIIEGLTEFYRQSPEVGSSIFTRAVIKMK